MIKDSSTTLPEEFQGYFEAVSVDQLYFNQVTKGYLKNGLIFATAVSVLISMIPLGIAIYQDELEQFFSLMLKLSPGFFFPHFIVVLSLIFDSGKAMLLDRERQLLILARGRRGESSFEDFDFENSKFKFPWNQIGLKVDSYHTTSVMVYRAVFFPKGTNRLLYDIGRSRKWCKGFIEYINDFMEYRPIKEKYESRMK